MAVGRARLRFRRSRHLVLYWQGSRLVVHNYATGRRVSAAPSLCLLLDRCADWKTRDEIAAALDLPARLVMRLVGRLVDRSMLERSDRPDPRARAMTALDRWNPEAGLFHTATKDVRFWPASEAARLARVQASRVPMPAPVKRYRGASRIELPKPARGEFADVLAARRTWRRFSRARPVTLTDLATLLGLSAGVQQWVPGPAGKLPLKTSPSGGARHPDRMLRSRSAGPGASPRHLSLRGRPTCARARARAGHVGAPRQLLPEQRLFRQGPCPRVPDGSLRPTAMALPLFACLQGGAGRGGPCLPDVLPDRDLAETGALLFDGPRRQPD